MRVPVVSFARGDAGSARLRCRPPVGLRFTKDCLGPEPWGRPAKSVRAARFAISRLSLQAALKPTARESTGRRDRSRDLALGAQEVVEGVEDKPDGSGGVARSGEDPGRLKLQSASWPSLRCAYETGYVTAWKRSLW